MKREQVAAALKYLGDKADVKRRYERLTSLDQPMDADAIDMALEMGGSFVPGVGQALAARDFERARRAGDELGMATAASSALPFGRLASKVTTAIGPKNLTKVKIPIEEIEHGESVTPGGKMTWPGATDLIKEYASRKTPLPPIEVVSNEVGMGTPWMVVDGSHRLEAARLRGQKTIDALISPYDEEGLALAKKLKEKQK